ncbi:hypothetical protein FSARC_5049 [Fusarium sarcochroum]|uniref:Glycoside hydrolase family 3 N-terminal domain-containing protein n=1 Tax=Fusarium sarcochroum TaxID=1208366 RepID=A0A8H4U0A6_9HYPO|nr:hypothetical protein FSARC_5049 [Fusarium sarcochroum]
MARYVSCSVGGSDPDGSGERASWKLTPSEPDSQGRNRLSLLRNVFRKRSILNLSTLQESVEMSEASVDFNHMGDRASSDDLNWAIGQVLFMGWDGSEVTSHIRKLIEEYHVGAIVLNGNNLKSAQHATKLIQELQTIAHQAGHSHPLLIAIDQEGGGLNALFDEELICGFPSAMGIAATGSLDLAYNTSKSTAEALKACGVRCAGDDPKEVSAFGIAAINGVKDAGLATCGKHFPACGSLNFLGSSLDMPIITQTLEELQSSTLVPFRNAIATGNLDSLLVGGCAISNSSMNVPHACLSSEIVDDLLRQDLGFDGVAISECLEMDALSQDIGIQNGAVMALEAGCDLILLCRSLDIQLEAIRGLGLGISNGITTRERLQISISRINRLKSACTSWQAALNPPGLTRLESLFAAHSALSKQAYERSITIVRDRDGLIPISKSMQQDEELLLLTPLVKPLPASKMARNMMQSEEISVRKHQDLQGSIIPDETSKTDGESVFRELGRSLARSRRAKLLHTSYTSNGVRPVHESLIKKASMIIIISTNATRNLYQASFAKYVDLMCSILRTQGQKKSVILIAVSSPYDFVMDKTVGTYLCTFDFTENAMKALVRVLCGHCVAEGSLPGTLRKNKKVAKSRQNWIVEEYDDDRDEPHLRELLQAVWQSSSETLKQLEWTTPASFDYSRSNMTPKHFVVRNSSTKILYGFLATYCTEDTGILATVLVHPAKRRLSIGRSLHRRAILHFRARPEIVDAQVGSCFPSVFLGLPLGDEVGEKWLRSMGWNDGRNKRLTNFILGDLGTWSMPGNIVAEIRQTKIGFDLFQGSGHPEGDKILNLVRQQTGQETVELYMLALTDEKSCGVIRAKAEDGSILGTAVVCAPQSPFSTFIPVLASGDTPTGGILAPLSFNRPQSSLVLQALVLMGTRQNKSQGARKTFLSLVH